MVSVAAYLLAKPSKSNTHIEVTNRVPSALPRRAATAETGGLKRALPWLAAPGHSPAAVGPFAFPAALLIVGLLAVNPLSAADVFGAGRTSISVKETPLWVVVPETRVWTSDDWSHAAWVVKGDGKIRVVCDGTPGPRFDALGEFSRQNDLVRVTNRGSTYVGITAGKWFCVSNGVVLGPYEEPNYGRRESARPGPRPVFALRGQVLFCPMWRQGKWVVVVDGREYGEYDNVWLPSQMEEGPDLFSGEMEAAASPDGRRWAFAAERDGRWLVVCDGVEGPPHDGIVRNSLLFSSSGAHFAYTALPAEAPVPAPDGRYRPTPYSILDGDAGALKYPYTEIAFSADGKQCVYTTWETLVKSGSTVYYVVRDGARGPAYDSANDLKLSPDGRHLAFLAWRGGQQMVVDDAGEYPVKGVDRVFMSGDGEHFAWFNCVASPPEDSKRILRAVVDGVASEPFEYGQYCPQGVFGAGGRFAYVYHRAGQDVLVVDGKEVAAALLIAQTVFSNDGRHVAWQASEYDTSRPDQTAKPRHWVVYLDGVALPDCKGAPAFTPDSRHLVTIDIDGGGPAGEGHGIAVGIDGVPHSVALDLPPIRLIDVRANALSVLCNRHGQYVRVDVTVTSDPDAAGSAAHP